MCIFLCRLTRKPILKSCLFLADCLHEDSHKPARSSQRSEYWPAENDFKDMYVWSLCLSVCTSMSWGIIYWNRRGRIISHVPPPISDDEINGWKLRGGVGEHEDEGLYIMEPWNRGEPTWDVRIKVEITTGRKTPYIGLELFVVEERLEAIALTHIVLL